MQEYQLTEADIKQLQEWGFEPDEINDADRIVYTYEDWLNPDRSMGLFPFGGWGIKAHYLTEKGDSTTKGNGKLTLFILPESEGQKIEQRKGEIVEGFVAAYFEALTSWFESQYEQSLEKKILTEKELKKVEKLLFEWNEDYRYHSYGEGFWLSFYTYANRKAGSMCDWYERFCVNGEDPKRAVSRHHATITANELNSPHPETLHYVVAALAFHRFKAYLNSKLAESDTPLPVQKAQIKPGYCCPDTDKIMENLVRQFEVTQTEVRLFEDFFHQHPYTNLDLGNPYRDKTTEDLDFEKLLTKIFNVSSLFNDEVQDYFFTCYLTDAEKQNRYRIGETDFYILKKRIEERRNLHSPPTEAQPPVKIKRKALEYLQILSGINVYGQQIMLDADFQRLKHYVETMIEQGKLPENLEPISQVRFPNGHIRFLFRCIHAEQYAERKIQDHFIDFIHAVFPKFTGKKGVTKRKFGEEPTTWKSDLEKMKGG